MSSHLFEYKGLKRAKNVSSLLLLLFFQSSCFRWARRALLAPVSSGRARVCPCTAVGKASLGLCLQPSSEKSRLVCTGNYVFQQSLTFAFDYLGFKRSCSLIHPRNDLSTWGNIVPIAQMASS